MPADAGPSRLDGITLLSPLSAEERAAVARQCRWRRFHANEQIIDHQGESRDVALVVDGRVRVLSHSPTGREISFDDIEAGGFLGEMAAIDGLPRSASAVALEEGTLIAFLAPRPFQDLVSGHPDLAMAVMRRLCRVVRIATDRVMELSTLGANNRVHAELLRLAKRGRMEGGTAVIAPIPVHADIASRVSTARETVSRVLNDLARDGLVERRADALVVRDLCRLEALVEDVRAGV
ncbi:Crp/Fnr family transcriptional regulator [Azospirillum brasilense]|uniref:Crp/Fnr family transcriptional regulator n=1 Tax=Azospirillum brasilense TaxID=192 RepID=A0A0P0F6I5_AZOBR|nr:MULTISPECIES: Crp/Fnr family transcriptional regulator [Azospirillum]ALJ35448.1 Crp/Fnr family transcriptional regulator [Azospirillum brasilense]MDW7556791.1 Crp/Fnr family transcriptional regulator [Azospirillum brasilense]MDW7596560.1 Crp/Fnr family transcriptional regulator [Azospirillum brasilense]MDW7631441.1 Crp/Fnr family transcriptional regulator [Azospirillum brasilense]MDX5954175.1 Crp/Fnr family transcriptional regulator [Azospirillum brasilense]